MVPAVRIDDSSMPVLPIGSERGRGAFPDPRTAYLLVQAEAQVGAQPSLVPQGAAAELGATSMMTSASRTKSSMSCVSSCYDLCCRYGLSDWNLPGVVPACSRSPVPTTHRLDRQAAVPSQPRAGPVPG